MKVRLIKLGKIFACFLVAYVGSYLYLSAYGQYEPILTDINRIEMLGWLPAGFGQSPIVQNGKVIRRLKFNAFLFYAYLPLVLLDWNTWHHDIHPGDETPYPVDPIFRAK